MTPLEQRKRGVELRAVEKIYGTASFAQPVVRDCSFSITPGKLTVMIGPSGCGKSTLVRLIAGFEQPTSGSILTDGVPIKGPGRDRLVLFQETALFPWMSTYENILYGPRARGEDTAEARAAAEELLHRVGLSAYRDKYPRQLSGGMQRRAELARAMINRPELMILDEPFRGLDAMTASLMQEYFETLHEETRGTALFVSTNIHEAVYLADRIVVMANKPTRVRAMLDVNLPRPRRLDDVMQSEHANAIKMTALSLLHEEALKSFSGAGKAGMDFVKAYEQRLAEEGRILPQQPPAAAEQVSGEIRE